MDQRRRLPDRDRAELLPWHVSEQNMRLKNQNIEDETLTIAVELAEKKREQDAAKQAKAEREKETLEIATQLGIAEYLGDARREAEKRRELAAQALVTSCHRRKIAGFIGAAVVSLILLALTLPTWLFFYFVFCGCSSFFASTQGHNPFCWFFPSLIGLIFNLISPPANVLSGPCLKEAQMNHNIKGILLSLLMVFLLTMTFWL